MQTSDNLLKLRLDNNIFKHYKGNLYLVLFIVKHTETDEDMVVYKSLYGMGELWTRPLSMFIENVDVDGVLIPRFEIVGVL